MRKDERKGAWTLLVIILLVGIVLALCGRNGGKEEVRDSSSKDSENIEAIILKEDSLSKEKEGRSEDLNYNKKAYKTRGKRERRSRRRSKVNAAKLPMRDLRSDTIYSKSDASVK